MAKLNNKATSADWSAKKTYSLVALWLGATIAAAGVALSISCRPNSKSESASMKVNQLADTSSKLMKPPQRAFETPRHRFSLGATAVIVIDSSNRSAIQQPRNLMMAAPVANHYR
jgi:hypothetical protein